MLLARALCGKDHHRSPTHPLRMVLRTSNRVPCPRPRHPSCDTLPAGRSTDRRSPGSLAGKGANRPKLPLRGYLAALVVATLWLPQLLDAGEPQAPGWGGRLSKEHLAALDRRRRVVVNFDASYFIVSQVEDVASKLDLPFTFADDPQTHIDSIWWSWGEGHIAPYPSKLLPLYDGEKYRRWVRDGIDVVETYLKATKQRNLEAFFSYRINGGDNDLGPTAVIPLKEQHPEWLHTMPWGIKVWDFKFPEVRQYKLDILREAAENYDFDGLDIDYARNAIVLQAGQQWTHRDSITQFMRSVRAMLQEIAAQRGRPYLLAARVGQTIEGNRLDGLDVETWAREQLVDIFVLGCRSFEADVYGFRRITAATPIKLYVALDDHHTTDGYCWPPIEVFRGVWSNWYRQGVDGVQTFNFKLSGDVRHHQAYTEMGDPEKLKYLDKHFVLQRRGGGHGPSVVPNPEDWHTPRYMYGNTNLLAQLPATLNNDGKADTLLELFVGDDLAGEAQRVRSINLRVLLNDPTTQKLPDDQKIQQALIRHFRQIDFLYNDPPRKDIANRFELRLNNVPLTSPAIESGWLVYHDVDPNAFAVGSNLVGARVTGRSPTASAPLLVEKLEVHVDYRQSPRR